jgi:hypothetical protein
MEDLKKRLESLCHLLPEDQTRNSWQDLFNEFIRQDEWDSALHILCDYLLEAESPPTLDVIDEIRVLHRLMNIEDDCVGRLLTKAKRSPL